MSFSHSEDKNLMVAIRLMQLMIDSGASIEETMRAIADEKLGKISRIFDAVLKESISGSYISDEIEKQMHGVHSKPFKKVLSILQMSLKEGLPVRESFSNLADTLEREEKLSRKGLVKKVTLASDVLTYVTVLAVVTIIFFLMGSMMQYGPFSITIITDELANGVLMLCIFISLLVTGYIRLQDGGHHD
ncbi:hypothetical protein GQ472_02355 [archaeon]|nr:hypothetical protein [archaeon]